MALSSSQFSEKQTAHLALPVLAVFLVSAGIIGLELALMRCLSVMGWHHFSYLVLSTALLGFGASGTLLTLVGPSLERRFGTWCTVLTLTFGLSVPLCFRAAQALPLDPQYVLYSSRQAALMVAYHLLLFVPFMLGATVIGLSLMHFSKRVHVLYGANLLGSGVGGLWMILLMFTLPEEDLLYVIAGLVLVAAVIWVAYTAIHPSVTSSQMVGVQGAIWRRPPARLLVAVTGSMAVLILLATLWPMELRIDQYKTLASVQRWEDQSDAEHLLTMHSPRAR